MDRTGQAPCPPLLLLLYAPEMLDVKKQNISIRKTAKIYVKKTSSLSTVVRPTITHIKQQNIFDIQHLRDIYHCY